MGVYASKEVEAHPKESEALEDMKEVLKSMKWRLSRLEADNAIMSKTITNLKVSNNEMGRSVAKLHEHVFKSKILEEGRGHSVRVPKGSRSLFVK